MRLTAVAFVALALGAVPAEAGRRLSPEVQALVDRADAGDVKAMFKLGTMYDFGQGVKRSGKKAMEWYMKAAQAGDAEAQNSVGSGLQADGKYADAKQWYERSAAQGHMLGTHNLGYLIDLGLGTPQDRQKAYELYVKAAEMGWGESMLNIAIMLSEGQVGTPDKFTSCLWARRALRFALPAQTQLKDTVNRAIPWLNGFLTAEERERCEKDDWMPSAALPATPQVAR